MRKLLKILIIEDFEDDVLLILRQLNKGGYDVEYERAETAERMRILLKEKEWDIVFSDYNMPRFSVQEALSILKESYIDIPFIVISGIIGEDIAVETMKSGAHDYIMKNNLNRLVPAVERELKESENRAIRRNIEEKQRQTEKQLLKLNRIYALLSHINQAIVRIHDTNKFLDEVTRITVETGKFSISRIDMIDSQTGRIKIASSYGMFGNNFQETNINFFDVDKNNEAARIAIKTGKHKIFNNIQSDLCRDSATEYGYKSYAAFPIIVFDKIVGIFNIYDNEINSFEKQDIELLDEITRDISFALEFMENDTKRKIAEEKNIKSLQEKETLIRELFHRTKNTMQMIYGLLVIQSSKYPGNTELQSVVRNTAERIQSISLVHKMLYMTKDLSNISIKSYIDELTDLIFQSFAISGERISLNSDIDDIPILIDTAIPLGLILNELLTNSLKHAFPENRNGKINISLKKSESDLIVLSYSDNGIGFPPGVDFINQDSFGMKLIYNIGENQMAGKLLIENNNGVNYKFEFPNNLYSARV